MLKIEDLKIEKKYEKLTPETKEQLHALEALILDDGEIYDPFVVWKDHNIIVDGHSRRKIQQKHPHLKYSIKEVAFGDWRDVIAWIVEHHIARKSFTLWQKLEMVRNCVEYWEAKEKAKKNQGTRTDLLAPGDKKPEAININQIIANKVNCCKTYVTMFNKVFKEASEGIKQRCREGNMSIKKAYNSLEPKKKPEKKPSISIETSKDDILDEAAKNQNLGKKSNKEFPDPKPIANKMISAETSEESIWMAINPIEGVVQIFKKQYEPEKGLIQVQVNSFACKGVSKENGVTILEAWHIDGSREDVSQKDDGDFESESKKAS